MTDCTAINCIKIASRNDCKILTSNDIPKCDVSTYQTVEPSITNDYLSYVIENCDVASYFYLNTHSFLDGKWIKKCELVDNRGNFLVNIEFEYIDVDMNKDVDVYVVNQLVKLNLDKLPLFHAKEIKFVINVYADETIGNLIINTSKKPCLYYVNGLYNSRTSDSINKFFVYKLHSSIIFSKTLNETDNSLVLSDDYLKSSTIDEVIIESNKPIANITTYMCNVVSKIDSIVYEYIEAKRTNREPKNNTYIVPIETNVERLQEENVKLILDIESETEVRVKINSCVLLKYFGTNTVREQS